MSGMQPQASRGLCFFENHEVFAVLTGFRSRQDHGPFGSAGMLPLFLFEKFFLEKCSKDRYIIKIKQRDPVVLLPLHRFVS